MAGRRIFENIMSQKKNKLKEIAIIENAKEIATHFFSEITVAILPSCFMNKR